VPGANVGLYVDVSNAYPEIAALEALTTRSTYSFGSWVECRLNLRGTICGDRDPRNH
jgi:hypothetical protein